MDIDLLLEIAQCDNIPVDSICIKGSGDALSIPLDNGECSIAIDEQKFNTTAEKKVALAHELGHCETYSFYNINSSADIQSRHEYRADAWAIKKLVPEKKLYKAFKNGIIEKWELAEEFAVTEEFIIKAFAYYESHKN